jgi:hypothetical protein
VFSKDFSGCTMVVYTQAGVRRVAHVAASAVPAMNCEHAFMRTIQGNAALPDRMVQTFHTAADGDGSERLRVIEPGTSAATSTV